MRLSMWILADWLRDYHPKPRIQEGKRTLRNARLYADNLRMERSTVYVGYAGDFIDGERKQVICANEHDMLFLDADDINQIHNEILDAFEYYNNWSDNLNEKLKTEYSLQDILTDSKPVLNRTIMLADASYYVYAQVGVEDRASADPELALVLNEHIMTLDTILFINQDSRVRVNSSFTYMLEVSKSSIRCAVRNLFFRGRHRGWLITDKLGNQLSRGEMDIQDELGDIIEHWMEYHQNQRELTEKSGVFLQIMEGSCHTHEDAYRRIESLNWRRNDEKLVYVFRYETENVSSSYALDRKLEQLGGAYTIHYEENQLMVVNSTLISMPVFEAALFSILESAKCFCGRSHKFIDIFQLKQSFELAKVAADYGYNGNNRIVDIESAALPYYFTLILKNSMVGLSHPAILSLRGYDDAHHTQLYHTLEVYLQCERNYVKTAGLLFIHRNTLLYRIERISELTGIDLNTPGIRLHILMSYQIERLSKEQQRNETK